MTDASTLLKRGIHDVVLNSLAPRRDDDLEKQRSTVRKAQKTFGAGIIAGIVVAVVALLGIVGLAAWFLLRRRRRARDRQAAVEKYMFNRSNIGTTNPPPAHVYDHGAGPWDAQNMHGGGGYPSPGPQTYGVAGTNNF